MSTLKLNSPMWFDTHCHLDMLKASPEETLAASRELGVKQMVTIGTKRESNAWIMETLPSLGADVFGAVGIHPHYADLYVKEDRDLIKTYIQSNPQIVAVGECGFDFHYGYSSADKQRRAFIGMMELALELDKPLVVHSREAEQATMEAMEPFLRKGLQAVMHSFTSSMELADFGIMHGCWFSFNGISTFKKSDSIREVLKKTPPDKVLLETDAPYLAPHPHRGSSNFPGWVSLVGEYLAEFLGLPADEFARQTTTNAQQFYRIAKA